jgi:hypothetical protein
MTGASETRGAGTCLSDGRSVENAMLVSMAMTAATVSSLASAGKLP